MKPPVRLQGTMFDRRRKLTEVDKEEIKTWHRQGTSIHEISRVTGVNRRLIQFILFPERHVHNLALRAERGGSRVYYVRKKHTLAMRKHRAHLKEVTALLGERSQDDQNSTVEMSPAPVREITACQTPRA